MRIDLEEMKIHLKTISEKSIEVMFIHGLAQEMCDTVLLQLPIVLINFKRRTNLFVNYLSTHNKTLFDVDLWLIYISSCGNNICLFVAGW